MVSEILFSTSLLFLGGGLYFGYNSFNSLQSKLSAMILLIAGLTYMYMSHIFGLDDTTNLRTWRYMDWTFTVPILIYQMYTFLKPKFRKIGTLLMSISCMLGMLLFGFLGEASIIPKLFGGLIGTMFSIYTFVSLANGIKKEQLNFYIGVLTLWMFYPIVYFMTDSLLTIVLYSIVDLTAKLGVAIYIHTKYEK
jgi:bacteriorhodopsin